MEGGARSDQAIIDQFQQRQMVRGDVRPGGGQTLEEEDDDKYQSRHDNPPEYVLAAVMRQNEQERSDKCYGRVYSLRTPGLQSWSIFLLLPSQSEQPSIRCHRRSLTMRQRFRPRLVTCVAVAVRLAEAWPRLQTILSTECGARCIFQQPYWTVFPIESNIPANLSRNDEPLI